MGKRGRELMNRAHRNERVERDKADEQYFQLTIKL
jgi:hypothetical protein